MKTTEAKPLNGKFRIDLSFSCPVCSEHVQSKDQSDEGAISELWCEHCNTTINLVNQTYVTDGWG